MRCAHCDTESDASFCPKCGELLDEEAAMTAARNDPNRVFGDRYVMLSLLGRGGMGAVYLAKDTQLDKTVAVKVLPTEVACDLRAIDWMKEEVRIAQDLRHEHIAAIYNFETDPGRQACFIVMEYISGVDLHSLLARSENERLELDAVAHMLKGCSAALAYAHSKRIIHRDIKPKNVMITREGSIKITDFGIARRLRETMSKISQTIIAGTPAYMAPEHLMGRKIDSRADVYSLGAMVYELLCGNPPFHKGQIDIQILQKEAPPLDASLFGGDAALAGRINAVIGKCLAKEPEDRYETATGFYRAFCEAAGIEPEQVPEKAETRTLASVKSAVTAALVDQQSMLAKTQTPLPRSDTPATPLSALEPTERTPAILTSAPGRRRSTFLVGVPVVMIAAVLVLALALISQSSKSTDDPETDTPPAVTEGPPKLAIAEFIVEGDSGANTPMSLSNTVMYRAKKVIKDRYEIVEPLELKGILESLGMKNTQLTDGESAKRLYDERGIRYLILCTVVKGAGTELEGKMIDLKDGKVMQQDDPFIRYAADIRRGAERLGDVLTLDDTHKKIYFLLDDARLARARDQFDEAVKLIDDALALDEKDEAIHQYKLDFTEANVKEALDRAKYRKYQEALDLLAVVRKYNYVPERVEELPGKLFLQMVSNGDEALDKRDYEKAIAAFEAALKLKDDAEVRDKLEESRNPKPLDKEGKTPGKSGKPEKGK